MSATASPSSRRTRGRKRLRVRFAKRSSTRAGLLVLAFAAAALLAVVSLAANSHPLTLAALALTIALAGVVAAFLIVTERRRHEAAERELTSEARFLESLVETMGSIAGGAEVLERTRQEAERLFEARAALLLPGERPRRAPAENAIVIPLRAHEEEIGVLRLTRQRPFDRDDLVRATVLADFAAREHENAELLDDAREREAERSRLSDQLELARNVQVDVDVEAAEQLAEKTQAAMYQIIREALDQAVHRGPPQTLSVTMRQTPDGGVETAIADDAPGERRRRSLEELEERARTLNGVLTVDQGEEAGTTVRVVLPPYATAR